MMLLILLVHSGPRSAAAFVWLFGPIQDVVCDGPAVSAVQGGPCSAAPDDVGHWPMSKEMFVVTVQTVKAVRDPGRPSCHHSRHRRRATALHWRMFVGEVIYGHRTGIVHYDTDTNMDTDTVQLPL